MANVWDEIDMASTAAVTAALRHGAAANASAACRHGSIDFVRAEHGTLVATGDLHDNPAHLARIVELAHLHAGSTTPYHVTFHELIHGDHLTNGLDLSYRVLTKAAALKAAFPEHVHVLLANHELAQITGRGVMKGGLNCVKAFNDGLEYVFGEEATLVASAVEAFIRSMSLALRVETLHRTVLVAHSVPEADDMGSFDPTVFDRPLRDEDFVPRRGSAQLMTWGRDTSAPHLERLATTWGVDLFILGHDAVEAGIEFRHGRTLVLNSDHARGVAALLDLAQPLPRNLSEVRTVPLATDSC